MSQIIRITSCILFLSLVLSKFSHAQVVEWLAKGGAEFADEAQDIAVDVEGNAYVAGYLHDMLVRIDSTYINDTLTIDGVDTVIDTLLIDTLNIISTAMITAKYNAMGEVQWVQKIGGRANDYGQAIAIDPMANVYSAGTFSDTIVYNGNTLASSSASDEDVLVAKYNSAGIPQWTQQFNGNGDADVVALLYNDEELVIGGNFNDTLLIGENTLAAANNTDIFMARLNTAGEIISATHIASENTVQLTGMQALNDGTLAITGYFDATLQLGANTLTAVGELDIFVARLQTDGTVLWAKSFGNVNNEGSSQISSDAANNLYLSGYFTNPLVLNGDTLTPSGLTDALLMKLDENGELMWWQQMGGSDVDIATAVHATPDGTSYVIGNYTANFSVNGVDYDTQANDNVFVLQYDADGNLKWYIFSKGIDYDAATALAYHADGYCYVTGSFRDDLFFDTNFIESTGSTDLFVLKLDVTNVTNVGIDSPNVLPTLSLSAYPNPSSDYMHVFVPQTNTQINQSNLQLCIRNMFGQIITTTSIQANTSTRLSVAQLPKGMYVLQVQGAQHTYAAYTFIKQ